jgi:trehalose 6-phosphate phosphatase
VNDILAKKHREVLAQVAWSNALVALDFDGTLAPITTRPEDSKMRPQTSRRLARIGQRYPAVVISGRSQADVSARLGDAKLFAVSGNHGLEPGRDLGRYRRKVERWSELLRVALGGLAGVEIEDKRYSLALHYRRSREKVRARAAIENAVKTLGGDIRAIAGKLVLNVVPAGAPHKGEALRRLRADAGCDTAIYVGDDVTDEDVFALDEPGRLLGIRVGRSSRSAAAWFIRSQLEIDALLDCLLELRADALRQRGGET